MLKNLQLYTEQAAGIFRINAENFLDSQKMRLLIDDDAGIGRYRGFAGSKSIERIDGEVRRSPRYQFDDNFHLSGGIIRDFFDFNFALFTGFDDAVDERSGRYPIGQFTNSKSLGIRFFYACPHFHAPSPLTSLIVGNIDQTTRLKIRIQVDFFTLQQLDGSFDQLIEVVG